MAPSIPRYTRVEVNPTETFLYDKACNSAYWPLSHLHCREPVHEALLEEMSGCRITKIDDSNELEELGVEFDQLRDRNCVAIPAV